MAALKDDVLAALGKISGPDGVPLPASGKLSEIVAADGKVFFSISVEAAAVKQWESVRERAEAAGINVVVDVRAGPVVDVITRYAQAHAVDVIVVEHRGHIFGDYLLGSTADRVAHRAPCPVLIVS
ncbi:MAG: universal stress protein [Xanthobacteraceae bacterium]